MPLNRSLLPIGIYEELISDNLSRLIGRLPASATIQGPLDSEASPTVLSRYMSDVLSSTLRNYDGDVSAQVNICNAVLQALRHETEGTESAAAIALPVKQLLAVTDTPFPGAVAPVRPATSLSFSSLFTGTRTDPTLLSQFQSEIESCDSIDILCSFIRWTGLRIMMPMLQAFSDRPGTRLRLLTTSYMGVTDPKAVESLSRLPNAELKVSYDTERTRLHAKAYLFHRNSGYGVGYIGSANISQAALTEGLEWTVKISRMETEHLWEKATGTFETYWNDPEFVSYGDAEKDRFRQAISLARSSTERDNDYFPFEIKPYGHQNEVLDKLRTEREVRNRNRNLVVAATGTGKTVISAFDYARQIPEDGKRPRLLFVAHREEILRQSLACFRAVLRDPNFGDLLVGNHQPAQWNHLFVSVQSWNSRKLCRFLASDHFSYVVIDECHHIEAATYRQLLEHLQPAILLGLTATPERADGLDILQFFGGHIAAEIRLPDAIYRELLCAFHYFGITDVVDLREVAWQRGGYQAESLNKLYVDNHARADLVVRQFREKLTDFRRARALGFCVSVSHAQYMADYFNRQGIPSYPLTGATPPDIRHSIQARLKRREISVIFTVDLYNEGVDIPEIDTVLFLRPTESLTVFLQQLGRGLRRHADKECLTVLDFIGQAHRNFNFESRFRALMTSSSTRIDKEIERGSPFLPPGCVLQFERIAQKYVLENIRGAITNHKTTFINGIRSFSQESGQALGLQNFLKYHEISLDTLYKKGSWSALCQEAGVEYGAPDPDPETEQLSTGVRRFAHLCGPKQIPALQEAIRLTREQLIRKCADDPRFANLLRIAWVSLFPHIDTADPIQGMDVLYRNPRFLDELKELLELRIDTIRSVPPAFHDRWESGLELHSCYTRDEILVGFHFGDRTRRQTVRQGVLQIPAARVDLFFVTCRKSDSEYSPTTRYDDYAISDMLFHWQSQSTTGEHSETGQRYIHHRQKGYTPLLFVRETKQTDNLANPYYFLGPLEYQSHTGSKPMSIQWRLEYPIPAHLLTMARRLTVG